MCYGCRVGTTRFKQFEYMVEIFLQSHSDLCNYSYKDQALPCAPTRRRGDFVYILRDRVIILEVDEYAHRYYERGCECIRILELHEQGQGKALFVVRFNPQKKLLQEMARVIHQCFVADLPDNLLSVQFVGYKEEYDVVKEVVRIAQERVLPLSKKSKY